MTCAAARLESSVARSTSSCGFSSRPRVYCSTALASPIRPLDKASLPLSLRRSALSSGVVLSDSSAARKSASPYALSASAASACASAPPAATAAAAAAPLRCASARFRSRSSSSCRSSSSVPKGMSGTLRGEVAELVTVHPGLRTLVGREHAVDGGSVEALVLEVGLEDQLELIRPKQAVAVEVEHLKRKRERLAERPRVERGVATDEDVERHGATFADDAGDRVAQQNVVDLERANDLDEVLGRKHAVLRHLVEKRPIPCKPHVIEPQDKLARQPCLFGQVA
eukprot:scaffold114153_cov69-Phaeocystis_antarctica.AAC.8